MLTRLLLALSFLVALPAAAQVNALPPTRHILVYGDAQARAIPDRFKITVNFEAVDPDAGAARQRVETQLRDVVARLKRAGAAEAGIVATSLSVEPSTRYDERSRQQVFEGTRVRRALTAQFDRKSALEAFLGGLQTSRELTVSDIRTELSSEPALRSALRAKAIASTRAKAETIARAYGATLGAVYSVSDVAPQFDYGIHEGDWPELYDWMPSAQGGELDRVQVTGSRFAPSRVGGGESLESGYVKFDDRIYAVFLLAD